MRPERIGTALLVATAFGVGGPVGELAAQDPERFPGVRLGVTYQTGRLPTIAIPPVTDRAGRPDVAETIHEILANDFDFSDAFIVLDRVPAASSDREIDYRLWDQLSADWLLLTRLDPGSGNQLYVQLYDVVFQRTAFEASIRLPDEASSSFRMNVHVVHDALFEEIIGEPGIAASRIAFSIREDDNRQEIWLIDSDGENLTRLTDHASAAAPGVAPPVSQSPEWSADGRSIVYHSSYSASGRWRVRERVLATAEDRELDLGRPGDAMTPAYVGDGRIVFSGYLGEQSGLFVYDAARNCCLEALTTGFSEVSPTVSPDGRTIAFNSGRIGPPQIFTKSLRSGQPELLSPYRFSARRKYFQPDWSPDGERVLFHGELEPGLHQVVVSELARGPDGFTQLTGHGGSGEDPANGNNEAPTWAPDSRHFAFICDRRDGHGLCVMDTVTGRIRRIVTGRRINSPAWSPPVGG